MFNGNSQHKIEFIWSHTVIGIEKQQILAGSFLDPKFSSRILPAVILAIESIFEVISAKSVREPLGVVGLRPVIHDDDLNPILT